MTMRLVAERESHQRFIRLMDNLINWPQRAVRGVERKAGDYIRLRFKRNFEVEGFPTKWAPLAERTVAERRRLGFPGTHPILQRTRELKRSVVERGHPYNVSELDIGGGTLTLTLGSRDPRFGLLHGGGTTPTGGVVPARPMTVLGTGADLQGLDRVLVYVFEQAAGVR